MARVLTCLSLFLFACVDSHGPASGTELRPSDADAASPSPRADEEVVPSCTSSQTAIWIDESDPGSLDEPHWVSLVAKRAPMRHDFTYAYQGPVTVTGVKSNEVQLLGSDGTSAIWSGPHPSLASGDVLWARFAQTFAAKKTFPRERRNQVRASEHGPFLVEDERIDSFDENGPTTYFLGVPVSEKVGCLTGRMGPCGSIEAMRGVTIHGDTDVTVVGSEPASVMIGGMKYDVSTTAASYRFPLEESDSGCVQSDTRSSELLLLGVLAGTAGANTTSHPD